MTGLSRGGRGLDYLGDQALSGITPCGLRLARWLRRLVVGLGWRWLIRNLSLGKVRTVLIVNFSAVGLGLVIGSKLFLDWMQRKERSLEIEWGHDEAFLHKFVSTGVPRPRGIRSPTVRCRAGERLPPRLLDARVGKRPRSPATAYLGQQVCVLILSHVRESMHGAFVSRFRLVLVGDTIALLGVESLSFEIAVNASDPPQMNRSTDSHYL
jgi:hypothetical protein